MYFDHKCSVGRQMTIENSVSNDFSSSFIDSINVFDCRLSGEVTATAAHSIAIIMLFLVHGVARIV